MGTNHEKPNLRLVLGDGPEAEQQKTDRMLELVKPRIDFDYLSNVISLPGNPFYKPDPPDSVA